jgi:hypothetical protein
MHKRFVQFARRNKWLLPIVLLALVQLACSMYVNEIYTVPVHIQLYCDTDLSDYYFGSYGACIVSAAETCPMINGVRSSECLTDWQNGSNIPIDCSTLSIIGPNAISTEATSAIFSWSEVTERHYYIARSFANGRLLAERPSWATSINLPVQTGTEPITFEVQAYTVSSLRCSVSVTIPRVAPPPVFDCSVFRLTAPLDGLPNGMTTFYWDALPGATGYRVRVADAFSPTTPLTSLSVAGDSTNVTLDLSSSLIGGSSSLVVTVEALNGETVACTDSRTLTRAWPAPPPPDNTQPAPPGFCGDLVCNPELGENTETCEEDCPAD